VYPIQEKRFTLSHYTTFEESLEIENGLRENLSFGEIAKRLSKDSTTISREIVAVRRSNVEVWFTIERDDESLL
jgi:IS30 family transposase